MIRKRRIIAILSFISLTIILVPNFFNLNNYKPEISKIIYKITKTHLLIDGDIKLFFIPSIQLKIKNANIFTDLSDENPIIKIDNAIIKINWISLLTGNFVINDIILDKPIINIDNNFKYKINKNQVNSDLANKYSDKKEKIRSNNIFDNISIKSGTLNYNFDKNKTIILDNINIKNNSESLDFSFSNNKTNITGKSRLNIAELINNNQYKKELSININISQQNKNSDIYSDIGSLKYNGFIKNNKIIGKIESDNIIIDKLIDHDFYTSRNQNSLIDKISAISDKKNIEKESKIYPLLDLDLNLKNTKFKSFIFDKINSNLKRESNNIDFIIRDSTIYKGSLKALVKLTNINSKSPNIKGDVNFDSIEINHIIDNNSPVPIYGKINGSISFNSQIDKFVANLNGTSDINIYNGEIKTLPQEFKNIFSTICNKKIDNISFDNIESKFIIDKGIITGNDGIITSDIGRVSFFGKINLNNNNIDYTVIPITLFDIDNKDQLSLSVKNNIHDLKYKISFKNDNITNKIKDNLIKKIDPDGKKIKNLESKLDKFLDKLK